MTIDINENKNQENKILDLNNYLNDIINSVADPIFVKDNDCRFLLANDSLCNMLGMERKDIIGKTLAESLPQNEMEHFLKIDRMVLDSGITNVSKEELTGKDKKILTIITKKNKIY